MLHLNTINNGNIRDKKISHMENSYKKNMNVNVKIGKRWESAYDRIRFRAKILPYCGKFPSLQNLFEFRPLTL